MRVAANSEPRPRTSRVMQVWAVCLTLAISLQGHTLWDVHGGEQVLGERCMRNEKYRYIAMAVSRHHTMVQPVTLQARSVFDIHSFG